MIYLDSSAVLKLLFDEPESAALESWLSQRAGTSLVSSELVKVEVVRSTRRLDWSVLPAARSFLSRLDLVPITSDLIESAGTVGGDVLRSLDAVHLATALSLGDALGVVVAYDHRLIDAVRASGLPAEHPGRM